MEYITVREAAKKWSLSIRRTQTICNEGLIEGAKKFGREWAIPESAEKPKDNRIKTSRYIKNKL